MHFQTPRLKHGSWSTWTLCLVTLSLFDLAGALPKPWWTARVWLSTGKEPSHSMLSNGYKSRVGFKELRKESEKEKEISVVLLNLSSGMMMMRMGRRQHRGRTTSPCCPTSVHQLEVKTKTRPTRHTASSAIGGWRALTHSEDNSIEDVHTRSGNNEIFIYSPNSWVFSTGVDGLWWNFAEMWCLYH